MDSLENKTPEELLALVDETEDKEVLRFIANELEVSFSGNTGVGTLKEKLIPVLTAKIEEQADSEEDEDDPVVQALKAKQEEAVKATAAEAAPKPKRGILDLPRTRLAEMNPRAEGLKEVERRAIVRAKALRLHRVRVSNLDPADSAVPGAIISVYNKYTGKVSKFIPFGEENEYGYHIPEILLNELKSRTYNLRKEVKKRGNTFGVKEYRTVQMKKFSIEELPMLTKQELRDLGDDQKARGALDREVA
ncbi:hypothetical protein vBRpoPV13_59 [Ruegeria phage vB_RpoP-V13]|uniref:N4 gp55-like protein n=1 Tax=Ruegeria phage vB_RpoP-V13 TaxID=2218612 RepID=A0A2Z4QI31_9CAUD|nr:hypothetical protein HYP63_gp59 [Ruegeria phage vB_RpoP-V13]AWY09416.1 hypothetical protein vBRpoPV13_59 [Ruegeria phage vB_RpoP-V13]